MNHQDQELDHEFPATEELEPLPEVRFRACDASLPLRIRQLGLPIIVNSSVLLHDLAL